MMQAQVGTSRDQPWGGPAAGTLFSAGTLIAVGQYAEFANWLQMSYRSIQEDQDNWLWRQASDVSFQLTIGQARYSVANIQLQLPLYEDLQYLHFIDDQRYLLCYDPAIGTADETFVYCVPYQDYRGWLDRNIVPQGKPTWMTRFPDYSLEFQPIPDKAYKINFDYNLGIDVLALSDTATPATMPAKWHEAIVWRACMYWAGSRENSAKYTFFETEYKRVMNRSYMSELTEVSQYLNEYS